MGYPEHLGSWQEECRSVRRPVTCGWAWVNSGLGVHRSSALRSSIVFDPAVQRLGGVLSVAGIACSSQTIDSDNSASESFSSARKHTSLVLVLSYLPRGVGGLRAVLWQWAGDGLPLPQAKAPLTVARGVIHFGPEPWRWGSGSFALQGWGGSRRAVRFGRSPSRRLRWSRPTS
jgi:hypothetical protein